MADGSVESNIPDKLKTFAAQIEANPRLEAVSKDIHKAMVIGIQGLPVAVRYLEPHNPEDIGIFTALETSRNAKGIEDINPDHPDSPEEIRAMAAGTMRHAKDPRTVPPDENYSLRYVVVDVTGKKANPTDFVIEKLKPADLEKDAPWEGLAMGNVTFFTDEEDHCKHLGQTAKTLNIELAYYNLDDLYKQYPHLEKIEDTAGQTVLTAFQEGIYLAILDVLRKAGTANISRDKININGYVNPDNERSMRVLRNLGFAEVEGVIERYSEEYPMPRKCFTLGKEQWEKFEKVYSEIIKPRALKAGNVSESLVYTPIPDAPFGIPLDKIDHRDSIKPPSDSVAPD